MKKQSDHINDDLLVKHLLHITTPEEQVAVEEWLAGQEDHRRYFEHFRLIWEESKKLEAVSTVDENEAWARFQQRVGNDRQTARVVKLDTRSPWLGIKRIAAVLIIALGITGAWYMLSRQSHTPPMIVSTGAQIRQDTLPDGSMVVLNKQSSLEYSGTGKQRNVKLAGEAFFNVASDPGKPFVIKINDVSVTVLGTSFNVKNSKGKTEVIVESGAVEVSKNNNSVQLKQHEKAVVADDQSAPVKQSNTDELYNYYRTQSFVCTNTPLWQLVDILNEAYGVNITIANPEKRNVQLNATFTRGSLDSTLKVIALTYEVTIEKNGSQIILK
ncbi:FecR domain-containing protein [Chitinophaga sp. 212800010-3]|uniref:FecR domain-containing protein n=1 Tax=unclassified Chitinophaga TaxID=2619133 RepID=UPI002DEFD76B|nr:FecR family protein [Chitinophaga sp. 212800010-3]